VNPKERLDTLSDEELRLRVRVLLEQCAKEEQGWPAIQAMRKGIEDDCGFPSLAYLAVIEIYTLLFGTGPGHDQRMQEFEERNRCRNCPHPMYQHDEEGCTVTIPYTEDPDFGDTQTCPCCQKGRRP
jgi:hypothetical protein